MERTYIAALLTALAVACARPAPAPSPAPPGAGGIAGDVAYLASRALAGRRAGTPGGDSAAAFIAGRYAELGLSGAFRSTLDGDGHGTCTNGAACASSYLQFFRVDAGTAQNVAAVMPGTDSTLRDEHIVVGAHYDHIGRSTRDALDPEVGSVIRPGADDNASGTAGVLELARRFARRPARRSVLFVHFDAEEIGLFGSAAFVERPPVPLKTMRLMVNLDMIGRLRGQRLSVDGSGRDRALRALVDSAAAAVGLDVDHSNALDARSDHASFTDAGIPAIALFTGFHADYHRATDIARRVNVIGLERVVSLAEAVIRATADRR